MSIDKARCGNLFNSRCHTIMKACRYLIGWIVISTPAFASSYDDCILQNIKGIQVPQAIAEVRKACQQKYDEEKRKRISEFGEPLDKDSSGVNSLKASNIWEIESPGFHAMRFTN